MSVAASTLTAIEAPPVRRPQVRQLRLHPVDLGRATRGRSTAPTAGPPRRRSTPRADRGPRSRSAASASRSSANARIVSKRLYRVCRGAVVGDDQRLAHQRVQEPQHLDVVARLGDGAQRRQVEAAGEHRRRPQGRALVVVQQVVGPGHRVPQRRLAIGPELGSGQQPEPVAQPVAHLDRAHRRHPRRGQLDAERQPVERSRRSRSPRPRSARRRSRTRAGRRGPARRTGSPRRTSRRPRSAETRSGASRPARAGALATSPGSEGRRSGRGSRPIAPAAAASTCSQLSTTISTRRPATASATVSMTRSIALRGDAEGGGDRVGDRVGVAHRGQLDEPRAVGELLGELRADREGEPGLADASDAGEGDERTGSGPATPPRDTLARARRGWSWSAAGSRGRPAGSPRQCGTSRLRHRIAGAWLNRPEPTREGPDGSPDAAGARRGRAESR